MPRRCWTTTTWVLYSTAIARRDHVVSKDLIHWTRLPPPVRPNQSDPKQWYDHSGSYDGGVSLLPGSLGGPTIVYDVIECRSCIKPGCKCIWGNGTACAGPCPAPDGGLIAPLPAAQVGASAPMDPPWMGIARAANASDEYLLVWEKDSNNPINFTGGPQTGGANAGSIWCTYYAQAICRCL